MSEETKKQLSLNDPLSQQDALGILVQAVRYAQTKGVYSLEDAALIGKAIDAFKPKEEAPEEHPTVHSGEGTV